MDARPRIDEDYLFLISQIKRIGYEVAAKVLADTERNLQEITTFDTFPEGEVNQFNPYILDFKNGLFIGDVHLPYHSKPALLEALYAGAKRNVDLVYLNGDIMDCYQISKHKKDPRNRNMKAEIDLAKSFFEYLRRLFPKSQIVHKFGNHEARWDNFLQEQAPQLLDIPEIELPALLQFDRYGIQHVEQQKVSKAGKLYVAHGHEYKSIFGGGIYNARNSRIKAGNHNILLSHYHRSQEDTGTDIEGSVKGGWVIGCLCDLRPSWLGFTQWTHGYAFVELQQDGDFVVENIKILS